MDTNGHGLYLHGVYRLVGKTDIIETLPPNK